jgi:hypothetical protein
MNVTSVVSKLLANENTVPTVCLIAAVDIALSLSPLDTSLPAVRADMSSWLVVLVDGAGLRLSSIKDGLTSRSEGER